MTEPQTKPGTMNLFPGSPIRMNLRNISSGCLRKTLTIGGVTCLFLVAFYVVNQHYRNSKHQHHQHQHHHKGKHHQDINAKAGASKIHQAINENFDKIKSRAGNIYVDSENEILSHFEHEDYDYVSDEEDDDEEEDDDDDDGGDDSGDDYDDDDDDDYYEHPALEAPK